MRGLTEAKAAQLPLQRPQSPLFSLHQSLETGVHHSDGEQDLCGPEPIAPQRSRESAYHPPAQVRNYAAVSKRRLVPPIISFTPPPKPSKEPPLSPIIIPPLRLRKRKARDPPPQMSLGAGRPVRLLIASIGNPPPYHTTRHSAGHILSKFLAAKLRLAPFTRNKLLGSGTASFGAEVGHPQYTLWQSASLMNVSGSGTVTAWKQFDKYQELAGDPVTALVVLHDELESPIGAIKLRRGDSSPKGHNGIKSIQTALKSAGILSLLGDRFVKIGVGIGRPASRERDDVSAWVLGQLTQVERNKIEAATDSLVAVIGNEVSRLERA